MANHEKKAWEFALKSFPKEWMLSEWEKPFYAVLTIGAFLLLNLALTSF